MSEPEWLAKQFEENRGHLRAVAYRMLGSLSEAEDATQEAWLRLSRSGAESVENIGGWLTTVVARICLDMLRSRTARREESLTEQPAEPAAKPARQSDPEQETLLADSVGLALLVVLDRLAPAERLAFVLHDMFDLPFEEIASIVGRTPTATRQLASRARRRVRGGELPTTSTLARQRKTVDAFLAALRTSDFAALVAVLDPEIVIHSEDVPVATSGQREIRGAENWAAQAIQFARGARAAHVALVNGSVGIVIAPRGKLFRVLRFTIENDRVQRIEVVGSPAHLAQLDLAVLSD
jgi:RNA polymerase sigma factor (sigma-70 family)